MTHSYHRIFNDTIIRSTILLLLVVFFNFSARPQQIAPQLVRYPIAESGMKVSLPHAPAAWKVEYSEDSSKILETEVPWDDFTFKVIAVVFKNPAAEGDLDDLLTTYLDYLKSVFDIREAGGYVKGHRLSSNKSAKGIADYWINRQKTEYNLKAWITPNNLAVLMIIGNKPFQLYQVSREFHDSFEFPSN